MTRRNARASAAGVGSTTRPETPSCTSSVGPPLSVQVMTGLAERERLDRHKPVVLVERRKDHSAAAGQVIDQGGLVEPTGQADAIGQAALAHQPRHLVERLALACQDGADAGGLRLRQRLDDQRHALQGREARDGEQVRLVVVHAVRTLGRRRVQHLGPDAAERLEAPLHGRRDHEERRDVAASADSDRRPRPARRRTFSLSRPFHDSGRLNASHWS